MNFTAWMRTRRRTPVFYGWWIVAATSAMMFFAAGIFFRGFIVFFVPVRKSLNLSNRQTSMVFSLARAEGGLEGLGVGWMIDRFGTRRIMIPGILLAALGYLAFSRVDSFLWFAVVYLGVISVGSSVAFQHALFAGANMWFVRRRAFVLSIITAASSLGGVALIPVINIIILDIGWRWASFISALIFLLVLLPLTSVLRQSPESIGLLPDGDRPRDLQPAAPGRRRQDASSPPVEETQEFEVAEALRTPSYWILAIVVGLRMTAVQGILVSLQPILIWKGASQETVGYLLSLMMGINVVARLVLGWGADKWSKSGMLAACLAMECIAFAFLIGGSWDGSRWAIYLYLLLEGIGDSSGFIIWATLGDYYGRRRFASLRGFMNFSHSWALVGSPIFVGWWADRTGGYRLPLWGAMGIMGLAALFAALMRKPRRRLPT